MAMIAIDYRDLQILCIYIYTGANTGFCSGGGQNRREAPENFFVPPLSSSGGDRIQEEGENQVTYQST